MPGILRRVEGVSVRGSLANPMDGKYCCADNRCVRAVNPVSSGYHGAKLSLYFRIKTFGAIGSGAMESGWFAGTTV